MTASSSDTMNIKADAVIVAAGCGKRSGLSVPKQFFEVSGKPVLAYTVEAFASYDNIKNVVVVLPNDDFEAYKTYMQTFISNVMFIRGGETRMQSVFNGLKALEYIDHCEIVCIHDGVRPYVTHDIIADSITTADKFGAALAAINITDTVKCVENGIVQSTCNRDVLFSAQTPQTFKFDLIKSAYDLAINNNIIFTDESAVAENAGIKVHISKGSRSNIKLTIPEDFEGLK